MKTEESAMDVRMEDRETRDISRQSRSAQSTSPATLRAAYLLSAAVAVLMTLAAAAGLLVDELYTDGEWARQAFRGADLVTLVLAVPLLVGSVLLARRGSRVAQVIWLGMLGYGVYNYAYAVFGAEFNDAFMLHIAIFSMSTFALACAVPSLVARWTLSTSRARVDRWIGAFLVIVGLGQGGLWVALIIRNALTGEVLRDIPVEGQHLVFALDTALLAPP